MPVELHEMAKFLVSQGEKVIPLWEGTKVPSLLQPNAVSLRFHFASRRSNIGRVLNGLAVLDCDTDEAECYLNNLKIESPCVVLSGARQRKHRYFRTVAGMQLKNWQDLNGVCGLDVKTGGHAYEVWPPSVLEGGREYRLLTEYVPREKLPPFPAILLKREEPIPKPKTQLSGFSGELPDERRIERARKYIATIHSISGSGGDRQLFRAACVCCSGLGSPGMRPVPVAGME